LRKFYSYLIFVFLIICRHSILPAQTDSVVVVFGDTRTKVSGNIRINHLVNQSISKKIMQLKPVAVFHTGDIVFNGLKKSAWVTFKKFFSIIIDSSRFYPCYGNHELHSKTVSHDFSLPNNGKWYSVNIMNMHFVIIDNFSDYTKDSEQYLWLENDLNNYEKNKFCAVIMHLPVYSSGPHNTQIKKLRKNLVPLFEKYGVDLVFNAHNHCYEKAFSNGIYYITTAGGGAPMYPKTKKIPESQLFTNTYHFCTLKIKDNRLVVQAIDTNMLVIDSFEIKQ
jgi:hypothetical protein